MGVGVDKFQNWLEIMVEILNMMGKNTGNVQHRTFPRQCKKMYINRLKNNEETKYFVKNPRSKKLKLDPSNSYAKKKKKTPHVTKKIFQKKLRHIFRKIINLSWA